ncbi:MAG: iron chelate uptake ABC transporter family permease subunit, partial [Sutterella sp.]|nr:iron chelate uptake ABC transporter family permease subunit [Sutterella sp.]
ALCGLVGWVGLLIPHAARMLFGGSVRRLIPGSKIKRISASDRWIPKSFE